MMWNAWSVPSGGCNGAAAASPGCIRPAFSGRSTSRLVGDASTPPLLLTAPGHRNEYGDRVGKVKPYLIDLESANGTTLNGEKLPEGRYLELREKDVVQFGLSAREYVLMLAGKD